MELEFCSHRGAWSTFATATRGNAIRDPRIAFLCYWIIRPNDTGEAIGFVQATVNGDSADVAWPNSAAIAVLSSLLRSSDSASDSEPVAADRSSTRTASSAR